MSKRNYIADNDELNEYVTLSEDGSSKINIAEEQIDSYVGPQERFIDSKRRIFGVATAGTSTTLTDTSSDSPLTSYQDNYFTYTQIQITGGTGENQRRRITASDTDSGTVTVDSAWDTTPDSTSAYRIVQVGKFPRKQDCNYDSDTDSWYKTIPEAVKAAVASQVEFMIELGDEYFSSDKTDKTRESISEYEYEKGGTGAAGVDSKSKLIAPKTRALLRGIMSRIGKMVV